MNSLIMFCY